MPTATTATDADLIARAAGGEQAAFTVLFERHADTVHDHVARWSRDTALAADATQEAFVSLLRNLDQLRDGQAVLAWLLRTARNRAVDQLRRTRRETTVDTTVPQAVLAATPTADTSPEVAAMTHETATLVWEIAEGLDDRTFSVLDLSVRQGLSGPEIAEVLDTTPGNANVLVHRMRDRMRTLLAGALLLRVPTRDCAELEQLRATAPDPVDLAAARGITAHAEECVTCGPRRSRAIAPLRSYAALAQVRAPVAVGAAVAAASAAHFGTVAPASQRLRRAGVAALAALLLLLVAGVASGLRGDDTDDDGAPTIAAEVVPSPSPDVVTSPTETLDVLPSPSPLPVVPPEPTVNPTVEPSPTTGPTAEPSPDPSPQPSPTPDPSPSPAALAIRIDSPAPGGTTTAERTDPDTGREVGAFTVTATVTGGDDVSVAWTTDREPEVVLLGGATGELDLWLATACEDTTHDLRATATDTATGETATAVVPVVVEHACTAPLDVTITQPGDDPASAAASEPAGRGCVAVVPVAAEAEGDDLTWTWTSDRLPGEVLLDQASGEVRLPVDGPNRVQHVLTATAERAGDGSTASDTVTIVVAPSC